MESFSSLSMFSFILPIFLKYDLSKLSNLINCFDSEDYWKKIINDQKPEDYWFEIRDMKLGNNPLIQSFLKSINLSIDPNLIAIHKVPAKMRMPKHVDIATKGCVRKCVLIIPLTKPCPGTRFYFNDEIIFSQPFISPTLVKVDIYHDIYNYLDKERITLQFSFKQSFDSMKAYFLSNPEYEVKC